METPALEVLQPNDHIPVQDTINQNIQKAPQNVKTTEQLEEEQKDFFKTSQYEQPAELRKYLEEKLANPYNKYCIDCKKNKTTHAVVWLGAFVCEHCANLHKTSFGGNQYSYVKNVFNESWDDYQLRSVQLGGNQNLFQIMKEYNIHDIDFVQKYKQPCVTWYRQKHMAAMDQTLFDSPKPPKDWEERAQMTKEQLGAAAYYAGENLQVLGGVLKEKGGTAAVVLKEKGGAAAVIMGEKAEQWKQKIQEKQISEKISAFISAKMSNYQNANNDPQLNQQQNDTQPPSTNQPQEKAE